MVEPLSSKFSFQEYYIRMKEIGKKTQYVIPKDTDEMAQFRQWCKYMGVKIFKNIYYPAYFKTDEGFTITGTVALEDIGPNETL